MQGKVYEKHQFWVVDHQFYQMQVAVKVIHASIEITHGWVLYYDEIQC